MEQEQSGFRPGITWRSLCATVFALVLTGMLIQFGEVFMCTNVGAEMAVSLPAIMVGMVLLVWLGLGTLIVRRRLMTRPEMLCVLYAMIIATPIMTQGLWHRFMGLITATPREGNFQYIDAFNDKLWPHGPNLLEGALARGKAGGAVTRGTVTWSKLEYEAHKEATLPVLSNTAADGVASISFDIPVSGKGRAHFMAGEPYLVSFLARPANLSPDSYYFARLYKDRDPVFNEVINEQQPAEVTFLHQKGFRRVGKYGVEVSDVPVKSLRLEIGLYGPGELAVVDPKLLSVAAVEASFQGRQIVDARTYNTLPESERTALVVKPERWLSWAGVKFLISGYIPLRDWGQTAVAWSAPVVFLLLGLYAVGVLMRRQWAESERYPFPLARIPCALIGLPEERDTFWAEVWRSRIMWAGLIIGLMWGMLRMWAFYNPKFPNTAIEVPISQYLDDPGWNGMWNVTLVVSALIVSVCMFFELNVLLSFLAGFFAYRSLLWVGKIAGLTVYTGYPFRYEQAVGAYLAYGVLVLFLCRKYLWRVLKDAFMNNRASSEGEALSYRTALLVFAGVHAGMAWWAHWLGVPAGGILVFFCFLMLVGFVAIKARCECGLPAGYFTPYNGMIMVALAGGMHVFGADGVLVTLIASGFLTTSVFFLIPGAQLEMIEYGRRYRIQPRHIGYAVALGILGGLFIGGWVFLSNNYALGSESLRNQWAFNQEWYFGSYKADLAQATSRLIQENGGAPVSGIQPATWGILFGAVVTTVLTLMRQIFAGFWFHPIGFILGSAYMLEEGGVWGSVLVAWVIRATVLKFGGAATVKTRLFPFFVGLFLGSMVFLVINTCYSAHLQARGIEHIYRALP